RFRGQDAVRQLRKPRLLGIRRCSRSFPQAPHRCRRGERAGRHDVAFQCRGVVAHSGVHFRLRTHARLKLVGRAAANLRRLAEDACARLAARESIPAEEIVRWHLLEDLRIFPRGATEVLTAPVVELGRAIIALLSGRLPEAPEGKHWFYGTPTGRETL